MNIVIWDIETDSSNTFYGSIIEIGAILMNDKFQELDKSLMQTSRGSNSSSWSSFSKSIELRHADKS